jgi:hypothetical protein
MFLFWEVIDTSSANTQIVLSQFFFFKFEGYRFHARSHRIMTTRNYNIFQKFNFHLIKAPIPPLEWICLNADGENWTEKAISLMKRQFVVSHTTRQTEIPALIDSCVTNTPFVKMLCPQGSGLSLYFRKNITCLSVGLLRIGQVFFCFL